MEIQTDDDWQHGRFRTPREKIPPYSTSDVAADMVLAQIVKLLARPDLGIVWTEQLNVARIQIAGMEVMLAYAATRALAICRLAPVVVA